MVRVGSQSKFWSVDPALRPVSYARRGYITRFLEYRPAVFALFLILLLLVVSLMAPLFTPYERDTIDLDNILAPPSAVHMLGTDELGRDLFTRLIYGGRFTLLVALLSVAIAIFIGVVTGSIAGYFGGPADYIVTSAVDLFLSVPTFLLLLIAASIGMGRLWTIPLVIGATSWMETARLVRVKLMSLREESFVEAARSMGLRNLSVVLRHLLPNALPSVIVAAAVGFAHAMLIESALSFLGFGVQPPLPTWGNMLHNAQGLMRVSPIGAFAPGFLIFITCLCFNFLGDGLRSSLAQETGSF